MTHIPRPLPKNILIRLPLRYARSERERDHPIRDKIEKWFNHPCPSIPRSYLSLCTKAAHILPHASYSTSVEIRRSVAIQPPRYSFNVWWHSTLQKSTERPPTHVRCAGVPPLRSPPPIKDDESHLPKPLVILQVALEGNISKSAIMDGFNRGVRSEWGWYDSVVDHSAVTRG